MSKISTRRLFRVAVGGAFAACPGAAGAQGGPATEIAYERAVAAAQAGEATQAAALFDALVAQMAPDDPLRTLALYGQGRAHEKRATPESACRAVAAFQAFIARPDAEPAKRARVSGSLVGLVSLCQTAGAASAPASAPAPAVAMPVSPTPAAEPEHPSSMPAWVATGGGAALLLGGVGLLVAAGGAVDEGDTAYARFEASDRTDATALKQGRDADDRATTYGISGYAMLGTGLGVAGLAAWLWLRDADAKTAVVPTDGGLTWVGAWP